MQRLAGVGIALVVLGAGVGVGTQAVAASGQEGEVHAAVKCGGTVKRLADDSKDNKRWSIYYKNCSSKSQKRKVDIQYAADLTCKKIGAGKTAKWSYRTGTLGPDHPRSVKKC